jgi:hypothetical protein
MSNEKQDRLALAQGLVTGLPKYCPNTLFVLNGKSYTSPQVVQVCSGLLSADVAVVQAKAAYSETVAEEKALLTTAVPLMQGMKDSLQLIFGNSPTTLAGLGISPRKKPAPLSAAALAAKSAKAEATRKARGTTSKKQKATVSGNVSGVSITPVVAGAQPAATQSAAVSPVTPASSTAGTTGSTSSHG